MKPTFPKRNLIGHTFGYWTITSLAEKRTRGFRWNVVCKCGTVAILRADQMISGHSKSCGCLKRQLLIARITKHGASHTPTHRSWRSMIARCTQPNNGNFRNYGGRGITVCDRWLNSFAAFVEDVGERPSLAHSIGRIDNDGPYSPSNCRWETNIEQGNNRRTNRWVTINGKRATVMQAARLSGINPERVYHRLDSGWSESDALTIPIGAIVKYHKTNGATRKKRTPKATETAANLALK